MKNIDELLKRANKFKFDYATRHGTALLDELAASLRAQQAEIERLKGEYARGIEDAALRCENLTWAADIDWWLKATKKDVSRKSALECAAAIRNLQKQKEDE